MGGTGQSGLEGRGRGAAGAGTGGVRAGAAGGLAGVGGRGRAGAGAGGAATLPASEVAAFCEGLAAMLSAGIQVDEGLSLLAESAAGTPLAEVCEGLYPQVAAGVGLAGAMRGCGRFPKHAVLLAELGEHSGRTEATLRSLATYYGEESRVMAKVRAAVGYPAALLLVMSVVLAFTVAVILPVFIGVYEDMAGSLTAGSGAAVSASVAVGWVTLAVTVLVTAVALAAVVASRSVGGQAVIVRALARLPFTRGAMSQLALSRFMGALATGLAAGSNVDSAMEEALGTVDDAELRAKLEPALASMSDAERGTGLAQAIAESGVLEPTYARMLSIGSRSGSVDLVLERMSGAFFDEAVEHVDGVIDAVEPVLAAFLTIAVGATLVSVMLPLIGMMGSVG